MNLLWGLVRLQPSNCGVHAAQVETIKAYIDKNRREPDLSTRVDAASHVFFGFYGIHRDAERCCRLNPILTAFLGIQGLVSSVSR